MTNNNNPNLDDIFSKYQNCEGALLPILHAVQSRYSYIPEKVVPQIAQVLNLSKAEVHGVISFYHDFKQTSQGENRVQICRGEACQAVGSRQLEAHAKKSLAIDFDQTTDNKKITLEAVYCLGNCACGPSVRVNDEILARVDNSAFDNIVTELQQAE